MTKTRNKLDEARFFLTKLDEHYFDHVQGIVDGRPQPPNFAYYLSAFVSAARSVTWVMRKEFSHTLGWAEWFQNQDLSEHKRDLLKLFNDLRVRSEKMEPLSLGHSFKFVGEPGAPEQDPRLPKMQVTISAVDDEEVFICGEVAAFQWTMDEFDGEDLLPSCKQYVELLASLVQECEQRFKVT